MIPLPLVFVAVAATKQRDKARERAAAVQQVKAAIHPSQVISAPVPRRPAAGQHPKTVATRGVASSGAGISQAAKAMVAAAAAMAKAKAAAAQVHPNVMALASAQLQPALHAYLAALHQWSLAFALLGANAPAPPMVPPSIFGGVVSLPSGVVPVPPDITIAAVSAWVNASSQHVHAKAWPSRPGPSAEPKDQAAWLNKWGLSPVVAYPEFHWITTGNGQEARAFLQRSDSDWVHWYQSPTGQWTYDHHYGTGFDMLNAVQQAGQAIGDAVAIVKHAAGELAHDASVATQFIAHPFEQALNAAMQLVDKQLDNLAKILPPEARPFLQGLKKAEHFLGGIAEGAIDPARVDWKAVAHQMEAATSLVPGLGTAVADVLATAEVLYDAITSSDPLEAALNAAYDYALSSVPGAAELRQWVDPVFHVLVDLVVKHESPTHAILDEVMKQVSDSPSFGSLSPRSVAASLAQFVVGKLGLA